MNSTLLASRPHRFCWWRHR